MLDEVVDGHGPGETWWRGPAGRWRVTATVFDSAKVPLPPYTVAPQGAAAVAVAPKWPDVPVSVEVDVPAGAACLSWAWPHKTAFKVEVLP